MVGALIDTMVDATWRREARGTGLRGRFTAARAAYHGHAAEYRAERDVAAIAAALSRLSARRLSLVGMRRGSLLHDVETLIARAREARRETDEILALMDSSASTSAGAIGRLAPRGAEARENLDSRQAA